MQKKTLILSPPLVVLSFQTKIRSSISFIIIIIFLLSRHRRRHLQHESRLMTPPPRTNTTTRLAVRALSPPCPPSPTHPRPLLWSQVMQRPRSRTPYSAHLCIEIHSYKEFYSYISPTSGAIIGLENTEEQEDKK